MSVLIVFRMKTILTHTRASFGKGQLDRFGASLALLLVDFLTGFGLVIPTRNTCISEDVEERQAFDSVSTTDSSELNASILHDIAHVNFKWIDSLAAHMEYNKAMNTLYLFRYPSFCAASLPPSSEDDEPETTKSVLHW